MYTKLIILLIYIISAVQSAKILAIVPTASYSHQITFRYLWKELSLRGHKVTLITTDPINDSSLSNLTEIDFSYCYQILKKHNYHQNVFKLGNDFSKLWDFFMELAEDYEDYFFKMPEIKNLMNNQNLHFDLVMVEYIQPLFLAFAEKFKANLIAIISVDSPIAGHFCLGNPVHPVLTPSIFLPYVQNLSFSQRLTSSIFNIIMTYKNYKILNENDLKVKKYFGENYTSLIKLQCQFELFFVNTHPLLDYVRPVVPGYISITGAHIQTKENLSQVSNRNKFKNCKQFILLEINL